MRKFLFKVIGFVFLIALSIFSYLCLADGKTDWFYLKFTSPIQSSLIVGTSRSAQALQPKYLNKVLKRNDIYNYAFTVPSAPYGKNYFESIKKKLNPNSSNGVFILDVNFSSLAKRIDTMTQKEIYTEPHDLIGKINNVTQKPNLEYLLNIYDQKYITILLNKISKSKDKSFFLNDDGWLHISLKSDTIYRNIRIKELILKSKINKNSLSDSLSSYRLDYLIKTIQYLKKHGNVYLVRIPVYKDLLKIENEIHPNFDKEMLNLSKTYKVPYININDHNGIYSYTDGSHMDVLSGKQFSIDLANKIKVLENQ